MSHGVRNLKAFEQSLFPAAPPSTENYDQTFIYPPNTLARILSGIGWIKSSQPEWGARYKSKADLPRMAASFISIYYCRYYLFRKDERIKLATTAWLTLFL